MAGGASESSAEEEVGSGAQEVVHCPPRPQRRGRESSPAPSRVMGSLPSPPYHVRGLAGDDTEALPLSSPAGAQRRGRDPAPRCRVWVPVPPLRGAGDD